MTCRICGKENPENKQFSVNDKMFQGTEKFEYFECQNCGTLQILEIPQNMAPYYPDSYYSLKSEISAKEKFINAVRDRVFYYGFPKFLVQKLSVKIPNLSLQAFLKTKPSKSSRILDVGCGEGKFLKSIFSLGFKNSFGIEPFALKEQQKPFPILKKILSQVNGTFDCITFNHVFEHVDDVHQTLEDCQKILSEKGKIIIRVPVKDSYAYEKYGENWAQWDAPRHFQLLTKKAFGILAEIHHFAILDYYCDSYKFQFAGSEKYKSGLKYQDSNAVFSKEELRHFTQKAQQLNAENKGDQVVVVLQIKN